MTDEGNSPDSGPLKAAIHNLEEAEAHLEAVRADEAKAQREIAEAIEDIKEAEADRNHVTVHVVHVNEVERASFKEKLTVTLQQLWDKSYLELKIDRKPKDVFQTGGLKPKSLMTHLGLTLEQAHQQKVIEDFHFGIASETGGA